jgi:hypothetical protein
MVFTSLVSIIFLSLDFHYYDEGSGRFRTSVAQESAQNRGSRGKSIVKKAEVSKATIYKWWPNKSLVALDARY